MEKIKIREIREMSIEELHKRIIDERGNLENLRFQHATSRVQNTDHLKKSRHLIARMMTVIRERELGKGEQNIAAPKQTSNKVSKTEE
jgi:large subunit ribosomal protein L29